MERPVAVVLGGTGAIGKELVSQLLKDGSWKTVVALGRREIQADSEASAAKLVNKVINMDRMREEASDVFATADTVFCTLGTTRKVAGSAEAFKKVDYEYVATSATLAKEGGACKHYSLVTAQGAKASQWASDAGLFHGLLYMQTKGRAEEAVKGREFAHTSIFRPGMLDRGAMLRSTERPFLGLLSALGMSIKVTEVAELLIRDAKRYLGEAGAAMPASVSVYEMKEMQRAAKEGRAPAL